MKKKISLALMDNNDHDYNAIGKRNHRMNPPMPSAYSPRLYTIHRAA